MDEEKVPKNMCERYDAIIALTDEVCLKYLDEGYARLSRKLAAALARKRPSPLATGKVNSWACGIVYALGFVNFLSDKTQKPYMKMEDLCALFGVSQATGAAKSKVIRDALNLTQLDPRWTHPSLMDENPLIWFLSINGIMIDARTAPREIQEQLFQRGYIPYIPADKGKESAE